MDDSQPAVIDSAHRVSIGYETYFFADNGAIEKFGSDPLRYCGVLTDPVTLRRFRPDQQSPSMTHNGRMYFFASDSTKQIFDMMPDMYAYPNLKMLPKDTTGVHGS